MDRQPRKVSRYQRGNQKPKIEKGQIIQWTKGQIIQWTKGQIIQWTKGQIMIFKTLHIKLKIEQQEPH